MTSWDDPGADPLADLIAAKEQAEQDYDRMRGGLPPRRYDPLAIVMPREWGLSEHRAAELVWRDPVTPTTEAVAARMAEVRPQWADLFGIDPDLTGGQDVNDYLDEHRGEA